MFQGKQSWIKKLEQSKEMKKKLDRSRKLITASAIFLAPITKVLILEQLLRAGPWAPSPIQFWHFSNIS